MGGASCRQITREQKQYPCNGRHILIYESRYASSQLHFDTSGRIPGGTIDISESAHPPTFHDLIASRQECAAVKPLITSPDDPPIDRTTERTLVRVVALADDLLAAALPFADGEFGTRIPFFIYPTD